MRHAKLNKRFGRSKSARKELMRSLARNTLLYSRIKTTLPKAKAASRLIDRLISLGKEETLQARRAAFDLLQDRSLVSRLVKDIAPLFKDRKGGYTRIIHLSNRHGDGAPIVMLELVERIKEQPKPKKEKVKAKEAPKEAVETPQEKLKPAEEAKEKPKPKEKPAKVKKEKPKIEKPKPAAEKEKPAPKKEGLFSRIKGIFKRKKD